MQSEATISVAFYRVSGWDIVTTDRSALRARDPCHCILNPSRQLLFKSYLVTGRGRARKRRLCQTAVSAGILKSRTLLCERQVVVTVFAKTDAMVSVQVTKAQDEEGDQPTLIFNVYCPKLSKSADVDLPHAMQKMMTGELHCG